MPQIATARLVAETGSLGYLNDDDSRLTFDRAEFKLNWEAGTRLLSVPFQILSGGTRLTLLGQIEAPLEAGGIWSFKIGGGTIVLTSPGAASDPPFVLNRIAVSGRYDAGKQRFIMDEGDIGNTSVGVAMSGNMDFSGGDRALDGWFCRHAHAGRIPETDLADFHQSGGTRLVQRAPPERHRRAHRDCGERAVRYAQGRRPAGSRRRIVNRSAGDGLRAAAGG